MRPESILFNIVYLQSLRCLLLPVRKWHINCTLMGQFAKTLFEVTWHGLVLVLAFFECGFFWYLRNRTCPPRRASEGAQPGS